MKIFVIGNHHADHKHPEYMANIIRTLSSQYQVKLVYIEETPYNSDINEFKENLDNLIKDASTVLVRAMIVILNFFSRPLPYTVWQSLYQLDAYKACRGNLIPAIEEGIESGTVQYLSPLPLKEISNEMTQLDSPDAKAANIILKKHKTRYEDNFYVCIKLGLTKFSKDDKGKTIIIVDTGINHVVNIVNRLVNDNYKHVHGLCHISGELKESDLYRKTGHSEAELKTITQHDHVNLVFGSRYLDIVKWFSSKVGVDNEVQWNGDKKQDVQEQKTESWCDYIARKASAIVGYKQKTM